MNGVLEKQCPLKKPCVCWPLLFSRYVKFAPSDEFTSWKALTYKRKSKVSPFILGKYFQLAAGGVEIF